MEIKIIQEPISFGEVKRIAEEQFGDLVKFVVDVERGIMAIGGDLHADEEAILLQNGSKQSDLWGINYYPDYPDGEKIEFDSMINIRPSQGNRSRDVENMEIQKRIIKIVNELITT